MEITELFGSNLRRIREAQGLSAETLGEKIGVTGKHIYDIEKLRKKPSIDVVIGAAKELSVKIGDLFEGEKTPDSIRLPVSKTLQKLMAIPDDVYEAAQGVPHGHEIWGIVKDYLENAKEETRLANLLNKG
jgi:transcriptional regulator with XRE-family HTH domain